MARSQTTWWRSVVVCMAVACMPVAVLAADPPSLQAQVKQANDLLKDGKLDDAWVLVGQALAQAEATGNPGVILPVLTMRQGMQTMRRDYPGAEATAQRAFALADQLGSPARMMGTAVALNATSMYLIWGRPAQAEPWARRTLAGLEAIERDGSLHQTGLGLLANVEEQLGKYALAQQHTEQEMALAAKKAPRNPARTVAMLMRLADLRSKRGDLTGAQAAWAQALPLQTTLAGQDKRAADFVALARIHRGLGQPADARAALDRAVAAAVAAGDVPALVLSTSRDQMARRQEANAKVSAWQGIGRLERDEGRLPEAEAAFRRAVAMSEAMDGPGNADLPPMQVDLADVLRDRGQWAAADAVYAAALAVMDQTVGGTAPRLPQALDGLARVRWAQGQRADAEALLRRAIELHALYIASDHPQLVPALQLLAEVLTATDRGAEAQAALARATAIREMQR